MRFRALPARRSAVIRWLSAGDAPENFPPGERALDNPPGLLAAGGDLSTARLVADRIRRSITAAMAVSGRSLRVGASFGMLVVEPDAGRAWMARGPGPVSHNAYVAVPLVGTVTRDELAAATFAVALRLI